MAITYIDKSDVLAWINVQLDDKASLGDIPDIIMDMAHAKVFSTLVQKSVSTIPSVDDDYHFLKFATMCWALELLCKSRLITQSSGDVLRDRFGDVAHDYQRSNPLFFFAQGSSQPFQELLPYETFRMYAYAFVTAYAKRAFYERTGYHTPSPKMFKDRTNRGYDWDEQGEGEFDDEESQAEIYPTDSGMSDYEDDIENHDYGL